MINSSIFNNLLQHEERQFSIREGERKIGSNSIPLSKSLVKTKDKPVDTLIADTAIKIFSYLNGASLRLCCLICKEWNTFVKEDKDNSLWNAVIGREIAFGKEKWAKYFGDIGKVPPLPENICEVLSSPCPSFDEKTIAASHMLVLIPEKINGIPLTLNSLRELVKTPMEGYKTDFSYISTRIIDELGNKSIENSYWVLMTRNLLEESKGKSYEVQNAMIFDLICKAKASYRVPKVLEAAICIFTKYVSTGKLLFSSDPLTYTRCQEKYEPFQAAIGGFGSKGPDLSYIYLERNKHGIAVLREF